MDELLATCFPCFFRDPNKFERVRRSGSPTGNYDKFEDEEEEFYSTEGDERLGKSVFWEECDGAMRH